MVGYSVCELMIVERKTRCGAAQENRAAEDVRGWAGENIPVHDKLPAEITRLVFVAVSASTYTFAVVPR